LILSLCDFFDPVDSANHCKRQRIQPFTYCRDAYPPWFADSRLLVQQTLC